MALNVQYEKKFGPVTFKSGQFYTFKYHNYENDPTPIIVFINAIQGTNPNTGHIWNLIQGINLSYIPRKDRKRFADDWRKVLEKTRNVQLTWKTVQAQYPYIQYGIRRYFLNFNITDMKHIPFSDVDKAVIGSWAKDFSNKLKQKIVNAFKRKKKR